MLTNDQVRQILAQIESNNGQNTNHPHITHGVNKGTHAAGTYGLTTALVQDLIKNDPKFANLAGMPWIGQKAYLEQHPEVQDGLVNKELGTLSKKTQDPRKIAYLWNQGTSLNPNNIPEEKLAATPYIQKFDKLTAKFNGGPSPASVNPVKENVAQQTNEVSPMAVRHPFDEKTIRDFITDPRNPFNNEFAQNDEEDNTDEEEEKSPLKNRYSSLI